MKIKHIIKHIATKLGYDINKISNVLFDYENEVDESIKIIKNNTMLSKKRLNFLYNMVVFCEQNNLPGVFVECGVWKGGAIGLMALANLKKGNGPRHLHLFDSFEEICEPDALIDGDRAINETKKWLKGKPTGKLSPLKGIYDKFGGPGSIEENKILMEEIIGYNPEYLHYHQGWFQDTLPKEIKSVNNICILHIDSDWYASTKICLEYLYPKVVKGGFIIIDDYGAYEGCRKAADEYIRNNNISSFMNHIDMECRYWIK